MTIAVVQTGDYSDALQKAKEALTDAGAAVGTTTVLGPTFRARLDLAAPNVLPKLRASHPAIANDWTGIVRILALAIAKGAPDQDVRSISETRAVEVDGRYDAPADCVIVVGGCSGDQESRTDTVDIPLVEQLLDLGAIVVGAEPEAAVVSYVPAYNRAGITTVDNVDTELGRVALVLSVRGRRGSYGTKPTARNGAFPPMEAPQ
jgi:hypothetical protein